MLFMRGIPDINFRFNIILILEKGEDVRQDFIIFISDAKVVKGTFVRSDRDHLLWLGKMADFWGALLRLGVIS